MNHKANKHGVVLVCVKFVLVKSIEIIALTTRVAHALSLETLQATCF